MSKVSEQRIREAAEELVNFRWGNATVSQASAAGTDMRDWQLGGTRLIRAARGAVDKVKAAKQSKTQAPGKIAQQAIEKSGIGGYKSAVAESVEDMKQMRNGSTTEKTDYATRVGGASDRVEALLKADFNSPQWQNNADYQYRTISEAAAKLAYNGDLRSRTEGDKISKFNKNSILLVGAAYKNHVSDEAKRVWAQEFARFGAPNDFKLEQFASKSAVHAEIAKDLKARI